MPTVATWPATARSRSPGTSSRPRRPSCRSTPGTSRTSAPTSRTGTVAVEMLRPASVLGIRMATEVGRGLPKVAALCGGRCGRRHGRGRRSTAARDPPAGRAGLVLAITPTSSRSTPWRAIAFWIRDAGSAWFLYLKAVFIIGGMIIPLEAAARTGCRTSPCCCRSGPWPTCPARLAAGLLGAGAAPRAAVLDRRARRRRHRRVPRRRAPTAGGRRVRRGLCGRRAATPFAEVAAKPRALGGPDADHDDQRLHLGGLLGAVLRQRRHPRRLGPRQHHLLQAVLTTAGGLVARAARQRPPHRHDGGRAASSTPCSRSRCRRCAFVLLRRIEPVNLGDLAFGIVLFFVACDPDTRAHGDLRAGERGVGDAAHRLPRAHRRAGVLHRPERERRARLPRHAAARRLPRRRVRRRHPRLPVHGGAGRVRLRRARPASSTTSTSAAPPRWSPWPARFAVAGRLDLHRWACAATPAAASGPRPASPTAIELGAVLPHASPVVTRSGQGRARRGGTVERGPACDAAGEADAGQGGARGAPRRRPAVRAEVGRVPLHRVPRRRRDRARLAQRPAAHPLLPRAGRAAAGRAARALRGRRRDRRGHRAAASTSTRSSSASTRPTSRVRMLAEKTPASFVAFDLLALDDRDLTGEPFSRAAPAAREGARRGPRPGAPHADDRRPGRGRGLVRPLRGRRLRRRDGQARRPALPAGQAGDVEGEARAHRRLRGGRVPLAQGRRGGRLAAARALRRRRQPAPRRRGQQLHRGAAHGAGRRAGAAARATRSTTTRGASGPTTRPRRRPRARCPAA